MVDTSELESFLNDKSCKDNDVIEILAEGIIEAKTDSTSGRKYRVLSLPVSINSGGASKLEVIYSPNSDAVEIMQKAWGKDTKGWVHKKFLVSIYPKMSFGVSKMAILPKIIQVKV